MLWFQHHYVGFLLLLSIGNTHAGTAAAAEDDDDSPCRLYLGPSHLSSDGKTVLGMYAGVDYDENDVIPNFELGIPLVDFTDVAANEEGDPEDYRNEIYKQILSFVEGQVWTADYGGAVKWEGNHSAVLAIPGMGSLANYHTGIYNVDWLQGSVLLRDGKYINPNVHGGEPHMARGAITPYYNFTMMATTKIPAGMELFANFGDTWDNNTADFNMFQDTITRWDYHHADELLKAILKFYDDYQEEFKTLSQEDGETLKEDILDFMLNQILGNAAGKSAKTIKSLIPNNVKKLRQVQEMGGTFQYRNSDMVRSPKWLKRYAVCVDQLEVKPSTIPEAGRGAFAKKKFKRHQVVAPSPMMHITDSMIMDMYKVTEVKGRDPETGRRTVIDTYYDYNQPPIGKQLLVNYCFFHPDSSVLLWPQGPYVNFINHAPTRPPYTGYEGPLANAFVTWSHYYNDNTLGDWTLEELVTRDYVSLVMDVVAMKNIEPGDEIFIDYGPLWQKAYDNYKRTYDERYAEAKDTHNWRLLASDMIEQYKNIPFPFNIKKSANPYPWNVATACFLSTKEVEDGKPMMNTTRKNIEILQFNAPTSFEEYNGMDMHICDVMDRTYVENAQDPKSMDNYRYTVIAKLGDGTLEQVIDVPHSAITFINRPYTSDIHVPGAFRHPIGIRDQDFPHLWRNSRRRQTVSE